jgi:hypothetical protein
MVVITVCLFSEDILYFWKKYIEGKQALLILMVGQLLAFFGVAAIYLNMTGRQNIFKSSFLR